MPKPSRTIHIYNKGSNWLLLDSDDTTPLYSVHWNTHTLPHMTVTRVGSEEKANIGSAAFIPTKKAGFFATASQIELELGYRQVCMEKRGGIFKTDKRCFESSQMGTLWWRGGVSATPFLKLVDDNNETIAIYKSVAYTGRVMGRFEIYSNPIGGDMLDELVVSGCAMISEQGTSMGQTAAMLSTAGVS